MPPMPSISGTKPVGSVVEPVVVAVVVLAVVESVDAVVESEVLASVLPVSSVASPSPLDSAPGSTVCVSTPARSARRAK